MAKTKTAKEAAGVESAAAEATPPVAVETQAEKTSAAPKGMVNFKASDKNRHLKAGQVYQIVECDAKVMEKNGHGKIID
jgi:hypothetical protein